MDMADSKAEPAAELARMQRLAATYARLPPGATLHTCGVCTEVGQLSDLLVQLQLQYIACTHRPGPSCKPPSSESDT